MWKKALTLIVGIFLAESILIQPVLAKYPSRPVEIVCLYSAGGATDVLARLIGDTASKYLGQPVVVVNKPGAAGSIAAADVINAPPDGHKLAILATTYFGLILKTQKVPFDPGHLVPLASFLQYQTGLAVRGDSPWKSLDDLLNYGRKNPGKIRWVHPGRGGQPHIQGLLLFKKAGVQTIDLPMPGLAEIVSGMLGGHVDAGIQSYGNFMDLVKTGKLRYLTFFRDQRYSRDPSIPCSAELGFPETAKVTVSWALWVHKDTPEEIKKTLMGAIKWTYEQPEFQKGVDQLGEEAKFGDPEYIRESIKRTEEVGVPILKELGLYLGK